MQKIIFLNRYFYPDHSATSQLLSELAFNLAEENMNIHVIASGQRYDDSNERLMRREVIRGVKVFRCRTTRFGRASLLGRMVDYLSYYISCTYTLAKIARKDDIIIAETDPPLISIPAAIISKIVHAKLINWVQDLFPEVAIRLKIKGFNSPLSLVIKKLRNMALNTAEINVVLGGCMADRLRHEGIKDDSVKIIHNWSDSRKIHPVNSNFNSLIKKWNLKNKFVVGYSGNMGRVHDFYTIMGAIKKLRNEKDIVFLFIGSGSQKPWVEEEVLRLGLTNVMFVPYQPYEKLSESLSAPDVHLITLKSDMEGLSTPSKFYGIAAAGRPVVFIGNGSGEIARILKEENCGKVVDIGDVSYLVSTLYDLKRKKRQRSQMGDLARQALVEKYDSNVAFSKWSIMLRGLINENENFLNKKSIAIDPTNENICFLEEKMDILNEKNNALVSRSISKYVHR